MSQDLEPLGVFLSYSYHDEALRKALGAHLAGLEREGTIRTWHARKIDAGLERQDEIDARLETAQLILLLISSDYIASNRCFELEMTRALERQKAGEARVVPILLRPCDWQVGHLAGLKPLPRNAQSITSWSDQDEAWTDLIRGIRAEISDLRGIPDYPDSGTRKLSLELEDAYRERAEVEAGGRSPRKIDAKIRGLKRRLREGGQLKAGDFLLKGRLLLRHLIAQGGFAQVWKAYDRDRQTLVAAKVLHTQYGRDESRRNRFFRGARQMARLHGNPGVVNVIERECHDVGYHFFVMEFLEGGDFRAAVLGSRISISERLAIILRVGETLQAAHDKGIIHRDIKPSNILLGAAGNPKLTDFDLVRAADTTGGTRTSKLGTFPYAAPEALTNAREALEPADVYGLGMTTLFALKGQDLSIDDLFEMSEFLDRLDVCEACRDALRRSVERKLQRRFRSVREFCDSLRESLAPPELESPPPEKEEERARVVIEPIPGPVDESPNVSLTRERVNEKDGSVLVYVPAGDYVLGAEDLGQDSKPVHQASLSPFWIGKYPITNAQYGCFLEATKYREPLYWADDRFNDPDQPVVGVSWLDARAYCKWAGLELPNEAQWEASVRGTDGRRYPWGNEEPTRVHADYGKSMNVDKPERIGSHRPGAGPFGAQNQVGCVWEWCQDVWSNRSDAHSEQLGSLEISEGVDRVLRGGSWADGAQSLPAVVRDRTRPTVRAQSIGFRAMSCCDKE